MEFVQSLGDDAPIYLVNELPQPTPQVNSDYCALILMDEPIQSESPLVSPWYPVETLIDGASVENNPTYIMMDESTFIPVLPDSLQNLQSAPYQFSFQDLFAETEEHIEVDPHVLDHAYAKKPRRKPKPRRTRNNRRQSAIDNFNRSRVGGQVFVHREIETRPRILTKPKVKPYQNLSLNCLNICNPHEQPVLLTVSEMLRSMGTSVKSYNQDMRQSKETDIEVVSIFGSEKIDNGTSGLFTNSADAPSQQQQDQCLYNPMTMTITSLADSHFQELEIKTGRDDVEPHFSPASPNENLMTMLESYVTSLETNTTDDFGIGDSTGHDCDNAMGPNTSLVIKERDQMIDPVPQYDSISSTAAKSSNSDTSGAGDELQVIEETAEAKRSSSIPFRTSKRSRNPPQRFLD